MTVITKLPRKKRINTQHVYRVSSVPDYYGYRNAFIFYINKITEQFWFANWL